MNYKLETYPGDQISRVATKAKEIATEKSNTVEFVFNEIVCMVDSNTNVSLLVRDYYNAFLMEWRQIGPVYLPEYSPSIQQELEQKTKDREEKRDKKLKELRKKEAAEKEQFEESIKGVDLELSDPEGWQKSREANGDSYGKCALDFAEGFAKLMQKDISNGKTVAQAYNDNQYKMGFLGITGFMFGAAVSTLTQTWKYGEELRRAHNKEFGLPEDTKGVANPAVVSIS